jgi:hypothetical protein
MNKELSARLLAFAEGPEAEEFLGMAEETFFADFVGETGVQTFDEVEKLIGEYGWLHVFPCLMEFFFSQDYALAAPGAPDIRWNAIDCFLAGEGANVTAAERQYLEGLRDSHMSLYRIVEAEPEGSLKLYDLIEKQTVTAKSSAELVAKMKPGDAYGVRVVNLGEAKTITGIVLPFGAGQAKKLAADLHDLLKDALKMLPLMSAAKRGEAPLTERDTQHLIRVMLTPEIATAFMLEMKERQSLQDTTQLLASAQPKRRKEAAPQPRRKSRKAH